MARHTFGGTSADFVTRNSVGGSITIVGGAVVNFYSAATSGTHYTDLLNNSGGAATTITAETDGSIKEFQGPSGVTTMWADAGGARRVKMVATDEAATYAAYSATGVETFQTVQSTPFRNWHAALANRDNALAKVMFCSHSFGEGNGADAVSKRSLNMLQSMLRAKYPCVTVTNPAGGPGFLPPYYAAPTLPAPAVNAGGAGTAVPSLGPGGRVMFLTAGKSYTWTVTGTDVDVISVKGSGAGTMLVTLDGVAQTGVNCFNASTVEGFTTRYSLGAAGSHTIKVEPSSGSIYVAGIIAYNGDTASGIMGFDASHTGWKASDFNGLATATGGFHSTMWGINPHLVLIQGGINEWTNNVSSATFKTDLQTMIGYIKAAVGPVPSIGLIIDYQDLGTYAETWDAFRQVYYDVQAADPTSIALLDMTLRMPTANGGGGTWGLNVSDGHPSNKGHAFYAQTILDWISPK